MHEELIARRRSVLSMAVMSLALFCAYGGSDDGDAQVATVATTPEATTSATQSGSATQPRASSPAPDATAPVHVCNLITAEEVSAAVGFTVGPGREYLAVARGATQCEWAGTGVVYVEVLAKGGEARFKAVHIPNAALPEVEISGLGDKALYSHDLNTVGVVSGDKYISVQLIGARSLGVDGKTAGAALGQGDPGYIEVRIR